MDNMNPEDIKPEIPATPTPKGIKTFYFEFFHDFREYLGDYVRETINELCIAEIPVKGQVKLFDGFSHAKVKIKNQGDTSCFLSTTGMGGYKLAPNESVELFVNSQVIATTVSGTTTLGFIQT